MNNYSRERLKKINKNCSKFKLITFLFYSFFFILFFFQSAGSEEIQ